MNAEIKSEVIIALRQCKDLLIRIAFTSDGPSCELCDVAEEVFGVKQCKLLEGATCPDSGCLIKCPIVKAVHDAARALVLEASDTHASETTNVNEDVGDFRFHWPIEEKKQ